MKILMIQRAERFSPNSVEKDKAILMAVADCLQQRGCEVEIVSEDAGLSEISGNIGDIRIIYSMARLPETLSWLRTLQDVRIVNAPEAIDNCARTRLQSIMECIGTPIPPEEGSDGYWLKRGDVAAQSKDDVQFAASREELEMKEREFVTRGITSYTVSAHVVGDLVKFYGVHATGFFRFFYPTDDGLTKFDDERRNGEACHFPFDEGKMYRVAERLSEATGVEVYGGDCIVRSDGSFCVIDFNDWPSFSRCCKEVAEAIASLVKVK